MSSGSQTIGYKYLMSMQMGIGRGPLNEIADIQIGGLSATGGDEICISREGQLYLIDKPDLFGGEEKEGGIQGPIYFYNGAADQELLGPTGTSLGTLPGIAASLGGDVPNFRGVVTAWFDGMVCALNPYPKEWSFRVRRTTAGWYNNNPWYPNKATINLTNGEGKIIRAMNPAHMLYEINTNPEWGRGIPPELIDENSYIYAADLFCAEGMGLCLPWFRQESIKDFIPVIINHIGAVQYVDRSTGKIALRPIRGDYNVEDLPVFGPDSGLLRLVDDDSSGEETAFNEIIIKGFDPVNKEDISVGVHNLASIQSLGEIISNTIEYKGLPTRELVARVASRELRMQTRLRRMTCYFDRRAWRISPGMPFVINYPQRGINFMVVRASENSYGTLTNGEIEIKVVEDVFGMPLTSYVSVQPPIWTKPDFTATPASAQKFMEVNWRDFYRKSKASDRDALIALGDGATVTGMVAAPPVGTAPRGYDLATHADGEAYATRLTGGFTATATLDANIAPLDTSMTLDPDTLSGFAGEFVDGMVVMIGDEQIGITTLNTTTGVAAIKRGVADTIPAAHTAGAIVWLVDDEIVSDQRDYTAGETVYGKALTRTATAVLALALAPEQSLVAAGRVNRPYPPGDVRIDGDSIYALTGFHVEPVLTFTHRDRLTQMDAVVGHTEGSIGPEAGVTYRVRIYNLAGTTLINTYDFVGATWTYEIALQVADGSPSVVMMELVSVRDTIESFFPYRFEVVLVEGWGYNWGGNWS